MEGARMGIRQRDTKGTKKREKRSGDKKTQHGSNSKIEKDETVAASRSWIFLSSQWGAATQKTSQNARRDETIAKDGEGKG